MSIAVSIARVLVDALTRAEAAPVTRLIVSPTRVVVMQGRHYVDITRAMEPDETSDAFDVARALVFNTIADMSVDKFRGVECVTFSQPTGPLGLRATLQTLIDANALDDEALAIVDETFQRLRARLPPGVDVAPLRVACRVLVSTYGRLRAPTPNERR